MAKSHLWRRAIYGEEPFMDLQPCVRGWVGVSGWVGGWVGGRGSRWARGIASPEVRSRCARRLADNGRAVRAAAGLTSRHCVSTGTATRVPLVGCDRTSQSGLAATATRESIASSVCCGRWGGASSWSLAARSGITFLAKKTASISVSSGGLNAACSPFCLRSKTDSRMPPPLTVSGQRQNSCLLPPVLSPAEGREFLRPAESPRGALRARDAVLLPSVSPQGRGRSGGTRGRGYP